MLCHLYGSFCLLNWDSAEFYSRLFDVVEQRAFAGKNRSFNNIILGNLECLSPQKETQARLLLQ